MTFNESNTVEALIRDQLCGGVTHQTAVGLGLARRNRQVSGLAWHYLIAANHQRQPQEVWVEDHRREALIHLSPHLRERDVEGNLLSRVGGEQWVW
jgi:type I restriction enzyme, R subunit